jgi:hypothetical protein
MTAIAPTLSSRAGGHYRCDVAFLGLAAAIALLIVGGIWYGWIHHAKS